MGLTLLDSSTIAAFLQRGDLLHAAADGAVREAARRGSIAVSAITVAEVLTGVHRGHHDDALVQRFFRRGVPTHYPVDDDVATGAAALRGRVRSLRLPDALILATADLHADAVITGDARWASVEGLDCDVRLLAA